MVGVTAQEIVYRTNLALSLILLAPLLSFLILILFGRLIKRSHLIALTASFISLFSSIFLIFAFYRTGRYEVSFNWLAFGGQGLKVGCLIDGLSSVAAFVVSFLVFFIELYSVNYMKGETRYTRFFAYLSLFAFSMLGLVLSQGYFQMYVMWELVGFCSYLLIGFWFERDAAAKAAKKAFFITRLGDMGFFLALLLLWSATGTLTFSSLFSRTFSTAFLTLVTILLFIGAVGKSAQFPLFIWLPDAMEGPTPVSALLHSATMVAAGVILVARSYPLFSKAPLTLSVVAWIGAISALLGALLAIAEKNLKRVLAFSTISQLGYMMLALGVGGLFASFFHFFTHAFFKALLFLCAGSLIHAYHAQDIDEMSGALLKLPYTTFAFLAGALSLVGLFPFSGFWSKDEILISVWESGNYWLSSLAIFTAFLTSFYVFKVFFRVFLGLPKRDLHEMPFLTQVSQIVLAFIAIFSGGAFGWLSGMMKSLVVEKEAHAGFLIPFLSTLMVVSGCFLAWLFYRYEWEGGFQASFLGMALHRWLFIEDFYRLIFLKPVPYLKTFFVNLEKWVVDGAVNGIAGAANYFSYNVRRWQQGYVQFYLGLSFVCLIILVMIWWLK